MVSLKIDPWDPGYGGSVEIDDPQDPAAGVVLDVETRQWEPIAGVRAPSAGALRCAFIDGVRRLDVRLFAEVDGVDAPAVAGSWAVGAAWNSKPPCIDSVVVGREMVLGGGLDHPDLEVVAGSLRLRYRASSVPDLNVASPPQHLQNYMREAEGRLAHTLFATGLADLLVLDGPLTYFAANGPVLGFIKRQNRAYLPPDRARIFQTMAPGSRTPLFVTGEAGKGRYSWYTRIAAGRPIDGVMTGVVRCEVATEVGLDEAVRLAGVASGLFPRFASQGWHDPRAPQNLYPVGQLEDRLRHLLGDPNLVRRALELTLRRSLYA